MVNAVSDGRVDKACFCGWWIVCDVGDVGFVYLGEIGLFGEEAASGSKDVSI